jgi:hypothetical protein
MRLGNIKKTPQALASYKNTNLLKISQINPVNLTGEVTSLLPRRDTYLGQSVPR